MSHRSEARPRWSSPTSDRPASILQWTMNTLRSMSTPPENAEIAADESADAEERERAIDELETANDCDKLAELVRRDDLDERYRERALEGLAHPQCRPRLQKLVDGGDLSESLRGRAETLLDDTPEGAGAGPS